MAAYVTVGVFILFDVVTGLIKALATGGIDSTKLRKGLYAKLSEIVAVIGSGLLEYGLNYINLGIDVPTLIIVTSYICVMELVSIIENLSEVNPQLAKLFRPYLEKLKEKESDTNDKKGN